jgi:hypothetical protein
LRYFHGILRFIKSLIKCYESSRVWILRLKNGSYQCQPCCDLIFGFELRAACSFEICVYKRPVKTSVVGEIVLLFHLLSCHLRWFCIVIGKIGLLKFRNPDPCLDPTSGLRLSFVSKSQVNRIQQEG